MLRVAVSCSQVQRNAASRGGMCQIAPEGATRSLIRCTYALEGATIRCRPFHHSLVE